MPGQEGVAAVFSPMARTLGDLTYFSKSILTMKAWEYDHTVHPLPWRADQELETQEKKTLKIGVLRTDGKSIGPVLDLL